MGTSSTRITIGSTSLKVTRRRDALDNTLRAKTMDATYATFARKPFANQARQGWKPPTGLALLHCSTMSSPTNVRFPDPVDKRLVEYAHRAGVKKSTVVVEALREWLRMEAHPGIVFVRTVTGERRAALAAGPQVWTVAEAWQQHSPRQREVAAIAATLGLAERDVETALAYWAEYRDEIDQLIDRHKADQDDALVSWERRRALDALEPPARSLSAR